MSPPRDNEAYGERETEDRVQAALRGARRIGPKPKASITPKRAKKQRKRAAKKT